MHGFNIMFGEPSEGDTRYNPTFLRTRSTRQPNFYHAPESMFGLRDVGRS
jgi:hypothetical protein